MTFEIAIPLKENLLCTCMHKFLTREVVLCGKGDGAENVDEVWELGEMVGRGGGDDGGHGKSDKRTKGTNGGPNKKMKLMFCLKFHVTRNRT